MKLKAKYAQVMKYAKKNNLKIKLFEDRNGAYLIVADATIELACRLNKKSDEYKDFEKNHKKDADDISAV